MNTAKRYPLPARISESAKLSRMIKEELGDEPRDDRRAARVDEDDVTMSSNFDSSFKFCSRSD